MEPKRQSLSSRLKASLRPAQSSNSVAVMATIISVCALAVSFYQAKLSRQQQLASVWPYVSVNGYGSADSELHVWGIRVINNGVGPAILERVELFLDGQSMPFEVFMGSLYRQNTRLDSLLSLNYTQNDLNKGAVLSAGSSTDWMKFEHRFRGEPPQETSAQRFLPKLSLAIYYKSLYDEHWVSCFNCMGSGAEEVRKLE